jgi:hypothetical protein
MLDTTALHVAAIVAGLDRRLDFLSFARLSV